jgi:uncharacterized Zn-finger protein
LAEREAGAVRCPYCGAPYGKLIPADVVQVECQYCGGTFQVQPRIGIEISRCPSHPEKAAVGICNDCKRSFCGECLHVYALETRDADATLYLCPTCLRARHVEKAERYIYAGVLLLLIGMFLCIVFLVFGIAAVVLGFGAIIYGFSKKPAAIEEPTIDELWAREKEEKAEFGDDFKAMHGELLTRYVNHWGVTTGTQLLDDEIRAYMRQGDSFPEAVTKVYQKQQNKH